MNWDPRETTNRLDTDSFLYRQNRAGDNFRNVNPLEGRLSRFKK